MAEALAGLFELLLQGMILLIEGVGRLLSFLIRAFWPSREHKTAKKDTEPYAEKDSGGT